MDDETIKALQFGVREGYDGRVVEPLHDWTYCRRIHRKDSGALRLSTGNVIIPGMKTDQHIEYQVMAVGPGRIGENGQREPMSVKVGDYVVADGHSDGFILDGQVHFVLRDSQIIGIIQGEVPEWLEDKKDSLEGIAREASEESALVRPIKKMPRKLVS